MKPNQIAQYKTSRDYNLLLELMVKQSIVCIVDSYGDCRDIANTIFFPERGGVYEVCSRGHGYITAFSKEEFVKTCTGSNVEFIVPEIL